MRRGAYASVTACAGLRISRQGGGRAPSWVRPRPLTLAGVGACCLAPRPVGREIVCSLAYAEGDDDAAPPSLPPSLPLTGPSGLCLHGLQATQEPTRPPSRRQVGGRTLRGRGEEGAFSSRGKGRAHLSVAARWPGGAPAGERGGLAWLRPPSLSRDSGLACPVRGEDEGRSADGYAYMRVLADREVR